MNRQEHGNMIMPNITRFSYTLFSVFAEKSTEPNILLSPWSIASALSLVLAGTTISSVAEEELRKALNVTSHLDLPHLSSTLINSTDPSIILTSANGIWSKNLKSSYKENLLNNHYAEGQSLLPSSHHQINEYIAKKTNGFIRNFLDDPIDPLSVAILVNAVHFKSCWTEKFDKSKSVPGKFTTATGQQRNAMFMNANRKMMVSLNTPELKGAHIVKLNYGRRSGSVVEFSAMFILPHDKEANSVNDVVKCLSDLSNNDDLFNHVMMNNMTNRFKIELVLPRFKLNYGTKSIAQELRSLGINTVFDGKQTLNQMSNDPDIHLDDVLHKAVMEITEEGTEAAAASVGVIRTRSLPTPTIPIVFDRPFVMVVLHERTQTPMFVARIDDPEFLL